MAKRQIKAKPVELDDIATRLNVIINLLLMDREERPKTMKDRILALHTMGVENTGIAKILGTTANHVAVELSRSKPKGE